MPQTPLAADYQFSDKAWFGNMNAHTTNSTAGPRDDRVVRMEEFLDVVARLIDARLQTPDDKYLTPAQKLESQFKQLPPSVEYAVIKWLRDCDPKIFVSFVADRFATRGQSYIDADADLSDRGSYYQGPSYLVDYTFRADLVSLLVGDGAVFTFGPIPPEVDQWMAEHGLFESSEDHPDPHFAERAFIINVYVPAFGAAALAYIEPQKRIPPYYVDFLVQTETGSVVIEVDGREYHDRERIGEDRFESALARQNELQGRGFPIFRYPARRILRDPRSVIDELRRDVRPLKENQRELFEATPESHPLGKAAALETACAWCHWYRPIQLALLLALSRAGGARTFTIDDHSGHGGLVRVAVHDLAILLSRAQSLYNVEASWPQKVIVRSPPDSSSTVANEYLHVVQAGPDCYRDADALFEIELQTLRTDAAWSGCDLVIDFSREGRIPLIPEGEKPDVLGRESCNVATLRARLKALSIDRRSGSNGLRPRNLRKRLLDYFLRRFLRVPSLYHHHDAANPKREERQYELVRRILAGLPAFGIMPTGRGKSIAFQLPGILLPGGALIVSPLRALMRDQKQDLRISRGLNGVESVSYDMAKSEKDRAIDDFIHGYTQLLYVSPERLQEITFSRKLAAAASLAHVSFLAVDEAHCVSEWGHDFRLSYMHVPHFLDDLAQQQGGRTCPIVALTATASPPVRKDVCEILRLDERDARDGGDFVAEANVDRTELSLSVHKVDGHEYPHDRQRVLEDVLRKSLPTALRNNHGLENWHDFARGGWNGRGAGAIFCLYKDSHGQTTWWDGVGAVRDCLLAKDLADAESIRLYASNSPGFCPLCCRDQQLVYAIRSLTRADCDGSDPPTGFECANGHRFTEAQYHNRWAKLLRGLNKTAL